jgi:hypothetical protein
MAIQEVEGPRTAKSLQRMMPKIPRANMTKWLGAIANTRAGDLRTAEDAG